VGGDVVHVAVVSDTHAPRFWKRLPPAVAAELDGADLILHAGDVCVPSVLDELAAVAPVVVVRGNNDGDDVAGWGATPTWEGEIGGLAVAMIHDSGPASGRAARMHHRFPGAELVVFGHSHIPMDVPPGVVPVHLFNPGSPTDKRRQPRGTVGLLEIQRGELTSHRIVPVT
jgi:uncharacterized protein